MMTNVLGRVVDRLTGTKQFAPDSSADAAQPRSQDFWRQSSTTYFGSDDYYERREHALELVLEAHGPWDCGIDIGCGDGRYTRQAAAHVREMRGTDISDALVQSAVDATRRAGPPNVTFGVAEAGDAYEGGPYDLALALGVTSCLVSDEAMASFLAAANAGTLGGATVITVDSLSRGEDQLTQFASGYVARYRTQHDYIHAFEHAGFRLEETIDLGTPAVGLLRRMLPAGRQVNRLFRFTRR